MKSPDVNGIINKILKVLFNKLTLFIIILLGIYNIDIVS